MSVLLCYESANLPKAIILGNSKRDRERPVLTIERIHDLMMDTSQKQILRWGWVMSESSAGRAGAVIYQALKDAVSRS
jgi:hypothetical protein